MGCCFAIRDSNSSAGGQFEQPSEVNSSTTTGVRVGLAAGDADCGRGRITAITAKTDSRLSVNPAKRDFMESPVPANYLILTLAKGFRHLPMNNALHRITSMLALTGYWRLNPAFLAFFHPVTWRPALP
jgi:hypothetical protein